MKDRKSKRLLVTLPESVVDDLELAHETTNWSKSQIGRASCRERV